MAVRYIMAFLVGVASAQPAWACTLCSCTTSTTDISFGNYDATAASPDDVSGTVTLSCSGVLALLGSIDIAMSPGTSGNSLARTMTQGTAQLNYNLYTDNARSIVWGNGSGGTNIVSAPLNGLLLFSRTVPVFARIPARQWVKNGSYADSVIVTVTY